MTTPGTADPGVSRVTAVVLATHLVDMYADLETKLATDIARRLAAGMDAPDWAQRKLAAVGELRRQARVLLLRAQRETEDEITQALLLAYVRGGTEAMRTISRLQNTLPEWLHLAGVNDPGPRIRDALSGKRSELDRKLGEINNAFPGIAGVMRLVRSLVLRIRGTHLPVLRWAEDVYREVIARAALPDVLLGVATRRRAAQVAWEKLLSQGVTGFVDRSGRRWDLASYVEMAARTGVAQAAIEGHMDRLADARIDLVAISDAPQECILCRPWEGKILARAGVLGPRVVQMEHGFRDGQMVTVNIAGTLAEAVASGLFHPNCRHSAHGYVPGVTRIPTHTADPEGDKARQRLRYLERQVRKNKLLGASAIDPAAGKEFKARVRAYQEKIRDHVTATGLHRQPQREQIGTAR